MGSHSRFSLNSRQHKLPAILLAIVLALFASGCKKKTPAPPPPPAPQARPVPPTAAAPTITSFEAEPGTIERGGDSTLKWAVSGDASSIAISPGIGTVAASGSRRVFPSQTTVYTLTVTGPGGTAERSATVTVNTPPPAPPPPAPRPTRTLADILASDIQDAYFDYDKSDIREDARNTLTRNADVLKTALQQFPTATILIEGHCDERGSAEYNLGLADRRAAAAREFLVQLGVSADRLKTVSYGKERPGCTEANEGCWQKNRRAHFAPGQ
jgi:peptidoglycan-associated lipoprotein